MRLHLIGTIQPELAVAIFTDLDLFVGFVVFRCCMNTRSFLRLGLVVTFSAVSALSAKDDVRLSYPSKVAAAKGKEREKLFTEWMTNQDITAHVEAMGKKGQQILFFEYNAPRDKWRALFSNKVDFRGGYSWWVFYGEKEMESKLNNEIKLGRQPVFITREGNAYAMLFVTPEHLASARKELDALGIGEPKLKN